MRLYSLRDPSHRWWFLGGGPAGRRPAAGCTSPRGSRAWTSRRSCRCPSSTARPHPGGADRGRVPAPGDHRPRGAGLRLPGAASPSLPEIAALELFHGPTLAFKDFGAASSRRAAAARRPAGGRPADRAHRDLRRHRGGGGARLPPRPRRRRGRALPRGRISALQERLFCTLGTNPLLRGGRCLRRLPAPGQGVLRRRGALLPLGLTSANSINVARLYAQVCTFFEGWPPRAGRCGDLRASGNFGHLTAGLMAARLGLPVKAFVAATNMNRTVPDFLESGVYRPASRSPRSRAPWTWARPTTGSG